MRIEIHPETEAEKDKQKEPMILQGVKRFGIAGIRTEVVDADGKITAPAEFGHVDGPILSVKADFNRVAMELDHHVQQEAAMNGAIRAHSHIMQQVNAQHIGQRLRNGKGLRLTD